MTLRRMIAFMWLCAGLSACGEPMIDDGAFDETSQPITGGTKLTPAGNAPYRAVVRIRYGNTSCTATKIGARKFLTAAHCVDEGAMRAGSAVRVTNDVNGNLAGAELTVAQLFIHPTWESAFMYDAAVFTVNEDSAAIPSMILNTLFVERGTPVTMVGYGCDGSTFDNQKRFATGTAIAPNAGAAGDEPYAVFVAGSNGETSCDGDSGGPLLRFDANRGEYRVVGVLSGTIGANPRRTLFTRVGNIAGWILDPVLNEVRHGQGGLFVNDGSRGNCAGVDGASTANGARLSLYPCDGRGGITASQYFTIKDAGSGHFTLVNGKSGRCLGVEGASTLAGAPVAQFTCDGNANQRWRFSVRGGTISVINGKSGKCLGVSGAGTRVGDDLAQVTCGDFAHQRWIFTH